MHILIVPSEYPTIDHKLGGIFTYEQERYLSISNKIGVIYIYLFALKKIFSPLFSKIFSLEKKNKRKFIFYFPRIPRLKLINYYLHYIFFIYVFKKYIKTNGKPDLLHIHFSEFSIFTAHKIKQIYNIPYVLTEHSTDFLDGKYESNYTKNKIIFRKIYDALKASKKIICVSSILKKKIKKIYKIKEEKFIIIPNLSRNISYRSKKKSNDLIFVGSLEERKNPMLLIKAFQKISNNKLKMKIIGDGVLSQKITKYINSNKLDKSIKVLKNLSRKLVLKMIGNSKILVLPSNYETFGIVIIEAYSMGVPVIMTDSLGVRDLYNKNCSILIKNKTTNLLASTIQKTLKNYKKYDSQKIISFYNKNFSSDAVINKIENLYRS